MASDTIGIQRRDLMKIVGGGIALAGVPTVTAVPTDTKTHFVELGWKFDLELPSDFREVASRINIDEPQIHQTDPKAGELHLSPWSNKKTKNRFKKYNKMYFADKYHGLDDKKKSAKKTDFVNRIAPVELNNDTRRVSGYEVSNSTELPSPKVKFKKSGMVVEPRNNGSQKESITVSKNEQVEVQFDQIELTLSERIPASDPRNESGIQAPMFQNRVVTGTPKLVIQNYGQLDVFINEVRGDSE